MDIEKNIPKDEPALLLSAIVERMKCKELIATYSDAGRNEYPPKVLLKICIYGCMRKIISTRGIEQACRENINFMYLLNGEAPPDHNTIHRFRSKHLASCQDAILKEMVEILQDMGELSFENSAVFIDGTKIESVGNRYQFVWKKSVQKHMEKLQQTIREKLPELLKSVGLRFYIEGEIKSRHLQKFRKKLCAIMKQEKIEKVSGKGKRKSQHQRVLETLEDWIGRIKSYTAKVHICGSRSSYCKTDPEATFMRMKEDHMLNGQLKPGYNINTATVSEYVVGSYVSSDRTDTVTAIPFMEKLRSAYPVKRVVYDSGYESEENYRYFEENPGIELYVKPANYEQKKQRKYRTDISRRENMAYDRIQDTYTCAEGKILRKVGTKHTKSSTGFVSEKTIYECGECSGCPRKGECIRSRSATPLDQRNKRLEVAQYFAEQRRNMTEKISTDEGKLLRMNRSIQAEGVFAYIKTDLSFRRFMTHGKKRVGAEWTLLALAYNVLRMHHKSRNGRLGMHLYEMVTV